MTIVPDFEKPQPRNDEEAIAAETILTFTTLWATGQDEAAIAFIDEGAVHTMYLGGTPLDYMGEVRGKHAVVERLRRCRTDWEYVLWRPGPMTVDGSVVRQQLEYMFKFRATGETISGTNRFVWTVRGGKVLSCDEFHDAARFEAFLRYFALPSNAPPANNGAGAS